ncbi:MAG: DNA-3-methyladenine glycosylase family protein [Thermomicrobiales bacterium]
MSKSVVPNRTFDLTAQGPFDFAESVRFWKGFTLFNAGEGAHEASVDLAFVPPGSNSAVGVRATGIPGGIHAEIYGDAPERIARDVARIFSLDVDARDFESLAERNPELTPLLDHYAGSRPVLFPSPYEAAAWAIISQRVRMTQAAKVKANLERELGELVQFPDNKLYAFPAPSVLRKLGPFPGLMATKVERLHGLAEAANEVLNPAQLRAMSPADADSAVQAIPGIGGFSAELILLRGVGFPDQLPITGQHMSEGISRLYRLSSVPDEATIREIAEDWRPFRGWVAFLMHRMLNDGAFE